MPDDAPDRVRHAADLHARLRALLIATMPDERPEDVATALAYELVSVVAAASPTPERAVSTLLKYLTTAIEQIDAFGVGAPHP